MMAPQERALRFSWYLADYLLVRMTRRSGYVPRYHAGRNRLHNSLLPCCGGMETSSPVSFSSAAWVDGLDDRSVQEGQVPGHLPFTLAGRLRELGRTRRR